MNDLDFLSGDAGGESDSSAAAPQVSPYPDTTGAAATQPGMVNPYPTATTDPALSPYNSMLGASGPVGASPEQLARFSQTGGGAGQTQPVAPAQLMPTGSGTQQVNYPGQPQAASTIGRAAKPC